MSDLIFILIETLEKTDNILLVLIVVLLAFACVLMIILSMIFLTDVFFARRMYKVYRTYMKEVYNYEEL